MQQFINTFATTVRVISYQVAQKITPPLTFLFDRLH